MTSFNYIIEPTRWNWSQTNQLEHESNSRSDRKLGLESFLSYDFKKLLTTLAQLLQVYIWKHLQKKKKKKKKKKKITEMAWRKIVRSVCLAPVVKWKVMFAYITCWFYFSACHLPPQKPSIELVTIKWS